MNTVVWIIIAVVVAILLIAAVVLLALNGRNRRRRAEAGRIRQQVNEETVKLERREALADETAARARAAKAEAEAKAAEAARLEERAGAHRTEIAGSRDELNKQTERAEQLHPTTREDRVNGEDGQQETVDRTASDARRDAT